MVTTIEQIEGLTKRLKKARQIVSDDKIFPVLGMDDHYAVQSSDGGGFYLVNSTCTCPDASERTDIHKGWCKHKLAVELFKESQSNTIDAATIEDHRESLYGPQKNGNEKDHRSSRETSTDGPKRNTHFGVSHE